MFSRLAEGLTKWGLGRAESKGSPGSVVAVCSRKGGVGKTTVAVHLSVALARWHGQRVLLLDLDPQGHVASSLYSLLPEDQKKRPQLSEIFLGKLKDLGPVARESVQENLKIACADQALGDAELLLPSRLGREFFLQHALKSARADYDCVILDCPPNLGLLTTNALVCADSVLVPTDLGTLSFQGILDLVDTVEELHDRLGTSPRLAGVLVSKKDGRNRNLNFTVGDELDQLYGGLLFPQHIPYSSLVVRACAEGRPVFDTSPYCPAARAYRDAAGELLRRLDK